MMRKLLWVCLLFMPYACLGEINGNNDFQFWNNDSIKIKTGKKSHIGLQTEQRWGDDASILYHAYIQGQYFYSLYEWLQIAPSYRHEWNLNPVNRQWVEIPNPLLDIIFKGKFKGWEFEDRNRGEIAFPEHEPNIWIYRNRISVFSPWKFGKIQLNPMMTEEVFFREYSGYSENRLCLGFAFKLSKINRNSLQLMFRERKTNNDEWFHQRVLFCMIEFSF